MLDINWLYKELLDHLGPSGWWPAESKQEIIIGAILVQNTNWQNAKKSLELLRSKTQFNTDKILNLSNDELIKLVKSSGFYNNKAKTIKAVYKWFNQRNWNFTFNKTETKSLIRKELLSISGIGNETADVYLVYIFDQVEFIADAYTRKLFKYLGLPHTDKYEQLKKQVKLPPNFTYQDAQELHGLIDEFGKVFLKSEKQFYESFLAKDLKKT